MAEIVRVLQTFLFRDLAFALGGGFVLWCFWQRGLWPEPVPGRSLSTGLAVPLLIGISYVIGYVVQEAACLLRLASTSGDHEPVLFVRWLKGLYEHREQRDPIEEGRPEDFTANERLIERHANHESFGRGVERYERILGQMQMGITVGFCAIIGGIALILERSWFVGWDPSVFGWIAIAVGVILSGLEVLNAVLRTLGRSPVDIGAIPASPTALNAALWRPGIVVGIGSIVVGVLLISDKSWLLCSPRAFGWIAIGVGIVLWTLGALKRAQLRQYVMDLAKDIRRAR